MVLFQLLDAVVPEHMAECEGLTEKLKAEYPMEWIGIMNALREVAAEIVNTEVILMKLKQI